MINVSNRVYEISALLNAENEEVPAMVSNRVAEISELIYNAKNGEEDAE